MKVQINSLQALQRLIDEDEELKLQIKAMVLNSLSKNALKATLNGEFADAMRKAINEEFADSNAFGAYIQKSTASTIPRYIPTEAFKHVIHSEVRSAFRELIKEEIVELEGEAKQMVDGTIKSTIGDICTWVSEANIDRLVREKLKKMIEQEH